MTRGNTLLSTQPQSVNQRPRLLGHLTRDALLGFLIYGFFRAGSWAAIRQLPLGRVFRLEPHGLAAVRQFIEGTLFVTAFLMLMTLLSYGVRPALGWLLRVFMALIFLPITGSLESSRILAVVQTEAIATSPVTAPATSVASARPSAAVFLFVRPGPFGRFQVPAERLGAIEIKESDKARYCTLEQIGNRSGDRIFLGPVWKGDRAGEQVFDSLIATLRAEEDRVLRAYSR